jgi:CheY-like chemotaxis protein
MPIIGVTAAVGDDAALIRRAGANAVLTKPLDVERIEDILEAHAARSGTVGDRSVAA